jgi:hypothetical protein
MSPKVLPPQPMSKLERDFHDALDRLIAGKPTHPELLALKREGKKLKINPRTVAKEARHSRTYIALEKPKFPDVRNRILDLKNPVLSPTDSSEVIGGLRRQVTELREKLHYQQDQMKAHFNARRSLEKDVERYKRKYERYRAVYDRSLKEAAAAEGRVIQLVPRDPNLLGED